VAEPKETSSRAAILLPTPDQRAYQTAFELARQVAASGWDVTAIEPRAGQTAALHDHGRDRGVRRFVLDVPVSDDAPPPLFGCTPAERLVANLLVERDIHVVHAHLAGELVVLPLLERAWLLGIPAVATVHDGWSPAPERAVLGQRLVHDILRRVSLVCRRGIEAPAVKTACDWTNLYRALAGDPAPPRTPLTLSVIVTTYQRRAVLRNCLEALSRQTLPRDRFEVVVVDDGSQPSAAPVVEAFGDRLDVRFVRLSTNVGLGQARNAGIEASRGDVLYFLDDDDEPAPRCLAEHLRTHADHGDEVEAVLGWTGPTADQATSVDGWLAFRSGLYISHWMRHLQSLDWFAFWGGRSSIRREALGDERFELPFLEDADLAYRLSQRRLSGRGLRVAHNRHAVQRVRVGLDAASLLRRAGRLGQARANLAHRHPALEANHAFAPERYARDLAAQLPERAGARVRTLTAGVRPGPGVTLERLRATPDPYGEGSQLERLAADLHTLSGAEMALGWALGRRRIAAREAGRRLRIGVSVCSPILPELVSRLRAAPGGTAVLVVAAPPGMSPAQLDTALEPLRAGLHGLDLETLCCHRVSELWAATDVVASTNLPDQVAADYGRADALPLPRGPLAESLRRLLHARDLVGNFR
jgi:hypothetical protein